MAVSLARRFYRHIPPTFPGAPPDAYLGSHDEEEFDRLAELAEADSEQLRQLRVQIHIAQPPIFRVPKPSDSIEAIRAATVAVDPGIENAVLVASFSPDGSVRKTWRLTRKQLDHATRKAQRGDNKAAFNADRVGDALSEVAACDMSAINRGERERLVRFHGQRWHELWTFAQLPRHARGELWRYGALRRDIDTFFEKVLRESGATIVFYGAARFNPRGTPQALLRHVLECKLKLRGGQLREVNEHNTSKVNTATDSVLAHVYDRRPNHRLSRAHAGPSGGEVRGIRYDQLLGTFANRDVVGVTGISVRGLAEFRGDTAPAALQPGFGGAPGTFELQAAT